MSENLPDVDRIDWGQWKPSELANLCFVMRDGKILLIRKKRGLGAGKINGPGGRIEPGESALEAAIRETREEIGVTPLGLEAIGELFFEFVDGYRLHVTVFAADDYEGDLIETDEATPQWTQIERIPYAEMWQDDPHWLPLLVARKRFKGYFTFDGEQLLSYRVDTE
jgi:8-oxo-dGTP diphosphatase